MKNTIVAIFLVLYVSLFGYLVYDIVSFEPGRPNAVEKLFKSKCEKAQDDYNASGYWAALMTVRGSLDPATEQRLEDVVGRAKTRMDEMCGVS